MKKDPPVKNGGYFIFGHSPNTTGCAQVRFLLPCHYYLLPVNGFHHKPPLCKGRWHVREKMTEGLSRKRALSLPANFSKRHNPSPASQELPLHKGAFPILPPQRNRHILCFCSPAIAFFEPAFFYHILRSDSRTFRNLASQSRRRRVYHPQLVAVYHQTEGLDIIKPQGDARWRVMRYKGGSPPLMICTARCAAMICQACGLDKQKENFG